jgi:RNA polymerase sigma-70 factor (ECF subfamily)
MEPEVAELVRRARDGETEAFGALVERFRDAVYGLCYHRCGDFDAARDLAQEAFVRAYQHLGQLSEPASFPRWLRRIAERVCLDWRRSRRPEEPLERAGERRTPGHEEQTALRLTVQQGLATLPEAQRLAVTLFHIDGYGYREIAEFLGTSETTVKARLDAGRERLRGALAEAFEGALRAQRPPARFREEVMMRVTQVRLKESTYGEKKLPEAVMLLAGDTHVLPLSIDDATATHMHIALGKAPHPRPMTYDLTLNCLAAFGIRLERIRVMKTDDAVAFAELEMRQGDTVHSVDCRPSDAVNLALRAEVPIEVEESVLEAVGMTAEEAESRFSAMPDFRPPWAR